MWPTVVVAADLLPDDTRIVLLGFAAMSINAWLFQLPDDPSYHAAALRALRSINSCLRPRLRTRRVYA